MCSGRSGPLGGGRYSAMSGIRLQWRAKVIDVTSFLPVTAGPERSRPAVRRQTSGRHLVGRPLQLGDLDLCHAQHGLHGPLGPAGIGVPEQLEERGWHDLPRDAEAVLEPSALALQPALGQSVPVVVDLVLVCAEGLERTGLAEGELRPAVEPHVLLPVQAEADGHGAAFGRGRPWTVAGHPTDTGVGKDRGVVRCCLLGLSVEPQAGNGLGHRSSPLLSGRSPAEVTTAPVRRTHHR